MKRISSSSFLLTMAVFAACFVVSLSGKAESSLAPEEIAVVVNVESPDSVRIGNLYIKLRNVPDDHLISLHTRPVEYVRREQYEAQISGPVRKAVGALYEKGRKIRCIVTTYGVPLKIGAVRPLIASDGKISDYEKIKKRKKDRLSELKKKRKEGHENRKNLSMAIKKLSAEISSLNLKLATLKGSDTIAAVDSELALLLVPDYPLAGWQTNPEFLPARGKVEYFGRVLMVSRLDGPSPELVEGLIQRAITVEKAGLYGKIYLDARGKTGNDAYARFDEEIRKTAQILKGSTMPVILDNRPELFGKGEAPSAALYCGWYSLGIYKDAFEWEEGAVGYHVASAEARSLRDPQKKYWVKSMIEKGVIVTLGPVSEPYLHAFPPPSLFFPLLMSGKYTVVEVFAMTNPLLSWRMILVGDPLYNPFKNRPAYREKNLPLPPR